MKKTQVAIIGGGPGGYVAAIRLNQLGIESVVFEKERLGGVCLNWGCIPTKTLVKSADLFSEISRAKKFGIEIKDAKIDYEKIYKRQEKVKNRLISGVEFLFRKRKIEVIHKEAKKICFHEDNYIISTNDEEVMAQYIIIATGSKPKTIPNINFDHKSILSSKDLLKIKELPAKLTIIGGGVIGCEFASIYSQLGVNVEIIEFLPTILNGEDEEIIKRLKIALKKHKIKIHLNTTVNEYTTTASGIKLKCSDNKELITDKVLISAGREPNCNLKFDNCCLDFSEKAIKINNRMETNLNNVFAIGDVTGKMLLAHVASKQAIEVAKSLNNKINSKNEVLKDINYHNIPRCTFTNPEIASVGLTEKQAKNKYDNIKIGKFPFRANGKALGIDETYGFVKTVASSSDDRLLGMHIIGPSATELIAEGTLLINNKSTAKEAMETVYAHPTLSEVVAESIEDLESKAIHKI